MIDIYLLLNVFVGIGLLLFLILYLRFQAFISLLIASIVVALLSGISPEGTMDLVKEGMGNTLGFVAVVVGLGAMFGGILERSKGAESIAQYLVNKLGDAHTNWAMMVTGFLVAIPVFFDVAFIILVPVIYAVQRRTGQSLLRYAIPLLAGLAITHAFIPPTPGPIAVADILNADLGRVIFFGFIVGLPTAVVSGILLGNYLGKRMHISAPALTTSEEGDADRPSPVLILMIIGLPIILILINTFINSPLTSSWGIPDSVGNTFKLIGHPFVALILANVIAWYLLGIRRQFSRKSLLDITTKSLGPAGIIILLTGAGGVFKQVLIETGAGEMLANYFAQQDVSLLLFGYLSAVCVRILQGSSTVAMITAAGLTAPLIGTQYGDTDLALLVIAIASGSSIMSHVNDSGFWLVSKYLGMTEKQTFKSWTVMTTVLSVTSFLVIVLLSVFI